MSRTWLLQDLYEKPSQLVLHRTPESGGLGLHHVQCRALAILITTFLEIATSHRFLHSLYAETLYRTYVLKKDCGDVV